MKKTKERIEWIDICKTFGILFVVMGHVGASKGADILLHAFHMPLFFILSGLCFDEIKHTKFTKFLVSRFKTLIIPYLIFSILLYYSWIGILHLTNYEAIGGFSNLSNCMFNPATITSCYGSVNWFLPALFIVEILFFLVGKLCKYQKVKMGLFMIIVFIIAFIYPKLTGYRIPLAVDTAVMGLGFYSVGWLLKSINYNKIKNFVKNYLLLSFLITAIAIFLIYSLVIINKMTNMRTLTYGNYSLYLINAFGLSFVFMFLSIVFEILSDRIKIINIIKRVGKHTLAILIFNPFFARLFLLFVSGKVNVSSNGILLLISFSVSILIIFICVLLSILINKFFPFLFGKKKNNVI